MEALPAGWLAEFETEEEDPVLMDSMDSFDDLSPQQFAALFNEEYQHTFSTSGNVNANAISVQNSSQICYETPTKKLKTGTNSGTSEERSSPENSVGSAKSRGKGVNQNKRARQPADRPTCTLEHVIAERKRREKLTQQFIALSAIVPGLKKMDKASVLGDCMKYVKHLQARVKTLEEQTTKRTMESAVYVKKFQVSSTTDSSSTDEKPDDFSQEPLPEVEVRVSDKDVMIRIHCEKQMGVLAHTLLATEKFNLSVISSSIIPFGISTFIITVLAQMETEFNLTVKDMVKELHSSISQFTGEASIDHAAISKP